MDFNNVFMILIIFLLVLVIFMGFFYVLYKNVKKDSFIYQEQARLAQTKLNDHMSTYEENKQNLIIAQSTITNLQTQLNDLKSNLNNSQQQIETLVNNKQELLQQNVELKAKLEHQYNLLEEAKKYHDLSNKELESRLTTLSEQILTKRQEQFSSFSEDKIKNIVSPIAKELNTFKEFVLQNQKLSSEQAGQLASDLKKLFETQELLSKQASDLTNALKSGGKSQGLWGEHQLELVLDNCGLIKGEHYKREVSGDHSNDEFGRIDAIVYLPQKHCLLIDAKCSLTAFCDYVNSNDDKIKQKALSKHLKSVKKHIDELAKRQYENYKEYNSPNFVFMFMPIDEALNLVLRYDYKLYAYASTKGVYLVSPISLVPTLKTVANLWLLSSQTERLKALASDAANIYSKALSIKTSYEDILKKESALNKAIGDLGSRLYLGRGNLITRIEKFTNQAPKALDAQEGIEITKPTQSLLEQEDKA